MARSHTNVLWDSESVTTNGVSSWARVNGPYITIFVDNEGGNEHVFNVELAPATGAGRNLTNPGSAGGGLTWYKMTDGFSFAAIVLTVAANANLAFTVPSGGGFVRLFCVSGTANDITATVSSPGLG